MIFLNITVKQFFMVMTFSSLAAFIYSFQARVSFPWHTLSTVQIENGTYSEADDTESTIESTMYEVGLINAAIESEKPEADHNYDINKQIFEPVNYFEENNSLISDKSATQVDPEPQMFNVLFIMSDDMRAQISPYDGPDSTFGPPKLSTPSLEKLASRSLLLKRMFVQYSLCGPSRTSMLTSRRPDITGIYDNKNYWRSVGGNFTTLPQHFKDNGYFTYGIGKIFHGGASSNNSDPRSWSRLPLTVRQTERRHLDQLGRTFDEGWLAVSAEAERLLPLPDSQVVDAATQFLQELAPRALSGQQHFFLAVGFQKPHLSLTCPERYFQLYPRESGRQYLPDLEWQTPFVRRGVGLPNTTRVDDLTESVLEDSLRDFRRAYFACVSYTDALIGRLLTAVETLGLGQETIISFIADHGYHLGENGVFGKQTLHDSSTRVPAMIHIPGRTDHGVKSSELVEAVDLFPTISEAAGLGRIAPCPAQASSVRLCTQGRSVLALIEQPDVALRDFVISQARKNRDIMGYSIRTKHFRYMFWIPKEVVSSNKLMVLDQSVSNFRQEMYDLRTDKEERYNVAQYPEYSEIINTLRELLAKSINATVLS